MTIATYGALKTQVRSFYSDRSDIPTIVYDLAAAELSARLNLVIMQSTSTLSLSAESTALPSDFLRPISLYLDTTPRRVLDFVDQFNKDNLHDSSGQPCTYTIVDGAILVNPVPDSTYSCVLRYIAKLDDFSADADTNAVLTAHPALYLYASLKHAGAWAQDAEAASMYGALLETEIDRVQKQDRMKRFGSGPLRSRAVAAP